MQLTFSGENVRKRTLTQSAECVNVSEMEDGGRSVSGDERFDPRRRAIHSAAIAEFSARGFAGTSMANIADAVGVSRPALYQYFKNKNDIFVSAFVALFEDHADLALEALTVEGTTAERLDGFLQRFEGDLWERLAASPHAEEIMNTKPAHAVEELQQVVSRLRGGLDTFLAGVAPGRGRAVVDRRAGWADVLVLAPKGFKSDTPSVADHRRRLAALAHSVAADVDASRPARSPRRGRTNPREQDR